MTGIRLQRWDARLDDIARRIRNEFVDMPGMHLTFAQARRLWHLSHHDCEAVLGRLVREGLLVRDSDLRYHLPQQPSVLAKAWLSTRRRERSA